MKLEINNEQKSIQINKELNQSFYTSQTYKDQYISGAQPVQSSNLAPYFPILKIILSIIG